MATINLRDFYPWYTQDEFVEVTDEIAGELFADKRYQLADKRRMHRNKVLSLDAEDGIGAAAAAHPTNNPDVILERKEQHCRLCRALNSLPEIQGRRVEAHYLHGKSQAEIAAAEGVTKGSVSLSITRGLAAMKIILKSFDFQSNFCPQSDMVYRGTFTPS